MHLTINSHIQRLYRSVLTASQSRVYRYQFLRPTSASAFISRSRFSQVCAGTSHSSLSSNASDLNQDYHGPEEKVISTLNHTSFPDSSTQSNDLSGSWRIFSLFENQQVDEAFDLLMSDENFDNILFRSLFFDLLIGSQKQYLKAWDYYCKMERFGPIRLTQSGYTILFYSIAKKLEQSSLKQYRYDPKLLEGVFSIWESLPLKTTALSNELLDICQFYSLFGGLEKASVVYKHMLSGAPDQGLLNAMAEKERKFNITQGTIVSEEWSEEHFQPNLRTHALMLRVCSSFLAIPGGQNYGDVVEFGHSVWTNVNLPSQDPWTIQNDPMACSLIEAYLRFCSRCPSYEDHSKAIPIIEQFFNLPTSTSANIISKSDSSISLLAPTRAVLRSLLSLALRMNQFELGHVWFEIITNKFAIIPDNHLLTLRIALLRRTHEYESAFQVMRQLKGKTSHRAGVRLRIAADASIFTKQRYLNQLNIRYSFVHPLTKTLPPIPMLHGNYSPTTLSWSDLVALDSYWLQRAVEAYVLTQQIPFVAENMKNFIIILHNHQAYSLILGILERSRFLDISEKLYDWAIQNPLERPRFKHSPALSYKEGYDFLNMRLQTLSLCADAMDHIIENSPSIDQNTIGKLERNAKRMVSRFNDEMLQQHATALFSSQNLDKDSLVYAARKMKSRVNSVIAKAKIWQDMTQKNQQTDIVSV